MNQSDVTFNSIYTDGLQHILSFEHPLEIWEMRKTAKAWMIASKFALQKVTITTCMCCPLRLYSEDGSSHGGSCEVRLLVCICPNLERIQGCPYCVYAVNFEVENRFRKTLFYFENNNL